MLPRTLTALRTAPLRTAAVAVTSAAPVARTVAMNRVSAIMSHLTAATSAVAPKAFTSRAAVMNTTAAASTVTTSNKPRIAIVYYSMYGHITEMAKRVAKGVEAAGGEVKIYRVAESPTLTPELLAKFGAAPKDESHEVITDPTLLTPYDGILFGVPTRFGSMPSQMSQFWDLAGGIWAKGEWIDKPAGFFVSTGTLGGGQEITVLNSLSKVVHHGMIYVPLGYSDMRVASMDEIHGGSPWGAGTFVGATGQRKSSEIELGLAEHQGKRFTAIAAALKTIKHVA